MATDPTPKLSNSYGPEVVLPLPEVSDTQANPSFKENKTKSPLISSEATLPSNKRENQPRLGLALLVFLVTAIVLGASLGGGLGAKLASCQNQLQM